MPSPSPPTKRTDKNWSSPVSPRGGSGSRSTHRSGAGGGSSVSGEFGAALRPGSAAATRKSDTPQQRTRTAMGVRDSRTSQKASKPGAARVGQLIRRIAPSTPWGLPRISLFPPRRDLRVRATRRSRASAADRCARFVPASRSPARPSRRRLRAVAGAREPRPPARRTRTSAGRATRPRRGGQRAALTRATAPSRSVSAIARRLFQSHGSGFSASRGDYASRWPKTARSGRRSCARLPSTVYRLPSTVYRLPSTSGARRPFFPLLSYAHRWGCTVPKLPWIARDPGLTLVKPPSVAPGSLRTQSGPHPGAVRRHSRRRHSDRRS